METIKLDLIPGKKMPSLHASQFDDGREHGIDLFENGVVYKLDGTETLTINERKGDDCICSLDIENTFADSNHIVFASTEQMCAVWGNNICELVITKGEKTLGTLNFILEIEPSPTEGGIESESEISNLERQITEITEQVIGDDYYTADQTDEAIATATEGKADTTYVDTELDKKADKNNTYTKSEVDSRLSTKAETSTVNALNDKVSEISTKSKNLNDKDTGRYRLNNGVINNVPTSTTIVGMSDKVPCNANTNYTATMYNLAGASTLYFAWYDTNGVWISTESKSSTTSITKKSPINASYVYTCAYRSAGLPDISNVKIQIEVGETSTDYAAPYTANDTTARENITEINNKSAVMKDNLTQGLFNTYYKKKYVYHAKTTYNSWIAIPSQSLYDVEYAKQLGFEAIELNVQATSDGKYICYHGSGGAWGNAVYSLDQSDISGVAINTMTLAQIQANVRYKSIFEKFKVAPATLEETLYTCKKNNIVPCVQNISGVIDIADKICGKGNYILQVYQSDRTAEMPPVICSWLTITNKDELVEKCKASGGSYVALLNASNVAYNGFDVDDWRELSDAVHSNGFRIGAAYVSNPILLNKLNDAGFDYIYCQYQVNDFENGNICNLSDNVSFKNLSISGQVQNETIVLTNGQTVTPNIDLPLCLFGGGYLRVKFVGSIIVKMGRYLTDTPDYIVTFSEPKEIVFSSIFENEIPTFTLVAKDTTTIYELSYKASKVDAIPLDNYYTKSEVDDIVYNILPDDTASGAVANFNTSLELPIKSLEVDVNAVQEAGTPTPSSPKAISGWNAITLDANGNTEVINLGGTYYGGHFTQDKDGKRELTVTHKALVFTGSESWQTSTTFFYLPVGTLDDIPIQSPSICSNGMSVTPMTNRQIRIYPSSGINSQYMTMDSTVSDIQSLFASGITFIYELAEPFTVALPDGEPINTFVGVNNFFADTGDTEVVFKSSVNDYVSAHSGGNLLGMGGVYLGGAKSGGSEEEPNEGEDTEKVKLDDPKEEIKTIGDTKKLGGE